MNRRLLLSVIIFPFFFTSDILGQTINRGPYLQSVTTGSIFIKWRTTSATASKVWYGSSPGSLNNQVNLGGSTTEHEVQITGLSANTQYYYAVGYGSTQLAGNDSDHYFNTSPPTNTNQTIRAWVLGNAGYHSGNDNHDDQRDVRDAFYSFNGSNPIDLMLLLGDNAYINGTDDDYQSALFEDMYEEDLKNSVMWSCFGNREGNSSDSDTETGPYYDIFTFPKNGEAGGVASTTEAYYSFDYGNIHFITLNTDDVDRDVGEPMITWLEQDLNATTQDWIVAIFHHPPYNGTDGNGSDNHPTETDMREDFVPILEAAGVDLVLSSHHHSYQRSFLIKDHHDVSATWNPFTMGIDLGDGRIDGDNAYHKAIDGEGTVYMVAGSAGTTASDPEGYPAMYAGIRELGSVVIEVTDLQMDVKFIQDDESIGDYFTIIKQIDPPTVDITSPMNGYFYNSNPGNITINATAADNSGNPSVEFFINGNSIGTDYSPPYNKTWNSPSNGNYEIKATATDGDGNVSNSIIKVRVGDGTICTKINKSANDAEEDDSGSVDLNSGDLELVNDGGNQTVGIRFENLNIPPGAVIEDAYIQFTSKNGDNENPRKIDIFGENSDYSLAFGEANSNISNRSKTNSSVSWYPDFWNSGDQSGSDQKTIQIRSIIQEVVNRTGFTMDSPITIIIDGYGKRVAKSFDGDASDAAELCIEFSNCTDTDGDGTCDANEICGNGNLEPGDPCDDGNSGTFNDLIQGDCSCAGTPYDCPALPGDIGDPCNDNDAGTYNDVIQANCLCAGTPYDCYPQPNDIGDSCDDGDSGTYNDVYNASCDCEGTAFDCPALQADIGETCDDGDPNTFNDEIDATCNCAGIPSGTGTLTSAFIVSGSDDAEEASGNIDLGSSDLEMIVDGNDNQMIGLRFTGLNIPQGMYIISAMIQFNADQTDNQNPCVLEIYGEASDNSVTFSNSNKISTRSKTNAKKDWSPDDWASVDDRGPEQRTVNIANVIQEIVNRSGYTSASAISLIIEGSGKRTADSYEGGAAKAPELTIIYDLSGPLPIELLDINATSRENGIIINWTTASETNNDYFTIERSIDGRTFESIGTQQGKGTTTEISKYSFLDKSPERGLNYYRLKQTDFDGQFSHSDVVSAEFKIDYEIQVYPTLVEDVLTVQQSSMNNGETMIIVHDITGRSFINSKIADNELKKELSLTDLIPGVYFISIYNNENVETHKIIKM